MSDQQKENASRIEAYLQNRLSPEEREAFKRSLSEDDELRRQYVDALMNRAGTEPNTGRAGEAVTRADDTVSGVDDRVSEADDTVRGVDDTVRGVDDPVIRADDSMIGADEAIAGAGGMITGADEAVIGAEDAGGGEVRVDKTEEEEYWPAANTKARSGFFGSGWMVGVTVLLLVIAGIVLFILNNHQDFWDKKVAAMAADSGTVNKGNGMEPAAAGSGKGQAAAAGSKGDAATAGAGSGAVAASGNAADSLFTKLYKPYMRGDDPIEVRQYYQDYRTGNYAAVLAADSVIAGVGARKLQIRDYMRLYRGLAYLATGNAKDAVTWLGGATFRTNPGEELYEASRWYLALAWLKRNDVDPAEAKGKALGLARDISRSFSRYREPARQLIRALGS